MDEQTVVEILNELLALEQRNLVTRLMESTVFISRLSVEDLSTVERMARASEENAAWLAEVIRSRGGVPGPRVNDVASADLHYNDLHRLLPRLITDRHSLIRKYTLAVKQLGTEPRTSELVVRIRDRHQDELTALQHLDSHNVSTAG